MAGAATEEVVLALILLAGGLESSNTPLPPLGVALILPMMMTVY